MRQIGTLPGTTDPQVFGDYLLSLGVTSRAVESKDGWAVWIHNEDHVARARIEFEAYQKSPGDPRYANSRQAAEKARLEQERLDREYRKNVRNVSSMWSGLNARRRPLTVTLIAICVAVFLIGMTSPRAQFELYDKLSFFPAHFILQGGGQPSDALAAGLEAIHRGQVWRLVTPIFLHPGGWMHLIFNVWAMSVLGSLIEYRRGTRTLLILVLLSAVASNVGEFLYQVFITQQVHGWGGISGVVYALFGYVWMKGHTEPESGMMLHPSSVRWMLLWLLLGFTGILRMANGAHVVGLIVGMLFGLARF